jgi:hypothetical protein
MKIFLKISKLIPKLLNLVKWLSKQGGWFYPIFLAKVFNYLITFLIKTEKIKF